MISRLFNAGHFVAAFLRREDQFIELKALEWRDFASLNKKRYRNVTIVVPGLMTSWHVSL
jgi:hypothetical protein